MERLEYDVSTLNLSKFPSHDKSQRTLHAHSLMYAVCNGLMHLGKLNRDKVSL